MSKLRLAATVIREMTTLFNCSQKTIVFVNHVTRRFRRHGSKPYDPEEVKVHPHNETPKFPNEFSTEGPPYGRIFDKKPFKITLETGKVYYWCACGASKHQPFCDGTHKTLWGTSEVKTMPRYRPIAFQVEKTKDYWLCNCKQSLKRPFCDGTHKREDIQAAIKT